MNKWARRYLDIAKNVATWSKDPSTQIGAVAVGDKGQILSQGYNGFPRGVKDADNRYNIREEKYKYVVHGEMNCIYNACNSGVSLNGATLYVTGLPVCSECAKGIIQVGISKVVMEYPKDIPDNWRKSLMFTEQMFNEAGVVCMTHEEE
jgi:dCMP deaminase